VGALAYDAMKPETRRAAQKMAFDARLSEMQYKAQNEIMDAAERDADIRTETRAPELARLISDRALANTQQAVITLSNAGIESGEQHAPLTMPAPVQALPAPGWPVAFRAAGGGGGSEATHQPTQAFAHVANSGAAAVFEQWQEDDQPTTTPPPPSAPAAEAQKPAPKVTRPKAKPGRKPVARNG